VDFQSLAANVKVTWRRRVSAGDLVRQMLLTYAGYLPPALAPRESTIAFRYPPPIGQVQFLMRNNAGADLFVHSEVFEHQYYRLPLPRRPATILDLGANIGLTAVYFARLFPDAALACIEPAPDNLRLLSANLALNGVRAAVMAAAVDANDRPLLLELQGRDYEHRIIEPSERTSRPTLQVEGVSVPTILRRLSWDRIGLLKVDIEGHEAALFAHDCDWLERVDAMCMEYHDHFAEDALSRLANKFGFDAPRRLPGSIWFLVRQDGARSRCCNAG
jgi:FkbM family methyltransferase